MLLYILMSFFLSVLIIPLVILFCRKFSVYDYTNERKVHSGNVPRLGSLGFVTASTVAALFYTAFSEQPDLNYFIPFIAGGLVIFIFGLIDDRFELRGFVKFIVQSIAAIIVISFDYRFTRVFSLNLGFFGYILTFCWIVGCTNAYNLIDGIDALCGGLSFMCILTIGIFNYKESSYIAGICFIVCAAIAGFLIYNKPKAKIFMGDGGSQFLGYLIAVLPLYNNHSELEGRKLILLILLSSIPIFDTIAAMWRRTREHRSFFDADKAHLHHKMMNLGYKTPAILVILYGIQFFCCCVVFLATETPGLKGIVVIICGYLAMTLFFALIHYTNRSVLESKKPGFKNEIEEH